MTGHCLSNPVRGVKFVSLHESSGYGVAARRYLTGLKNSGIPLTWTPMVPGDAWGAWYEPFLGSSVGLPELDSFCNRRIGYDVVIVHMVPEYYPRWLELEKGKRVIGCTVWETDRLPRHWPDLLNRMDRLLVPCEWNREVFQRCGVTVPVDVIPHIAADGEPAAGALPWGIRADDYVFYTIGAWTARKALWNTINGYLSTFTAADPAVLVVKTTRRDLTRRRRFFSAKTRGSLRRLVRGHKRPARIRLIDEELDEDAMLALHGRGDCYVSLTRSEGWGLGAFDAAAFGRPVIMTGYGGQLDYLPADAAMLVDYRLVPVHDEMGRPSYTEDQRWAEPDLSHASLLMRRVFEDRQLGVRQGQRLRAYVRERFSEPCVMERLIRVLSSADSGAGTALADGRTQV